MQLGTTTSNLASHSPTLNRISPSSLSLSLSASLPPSSSGKVSSLSFSRPLLPVSNHFGVLSSEEYLFPLSLSPMSKSTCQCSRRKHRPLVTLRIFSATVSSSETISSTVLPSPASSAVLSSSAISSTSTPASASSACAPVLAPISLSSTYDLESDDPITLPYTVNENHHTTYMIDSGASSQFINLDFALGLNLAFDKKNTPEDLVLANGVCSKVGQITHTCTLKLMIDQHLKTLTFHVTKLVEWNLIVGKLWLKHHNSTVNWTINLVTFTSGFCHAHCLPTCTKTPALLQNPSPEKALSDTPPKLGITLISHAALRVAVRCLGAECYVITMIAMAAAIDKSTSTAKLVPPEYYDYLSVFSEIEARTLPPQRYVDHAIPLVERGKPPFSRMYSMSDTDLKELKQWIVDNLSKLFICASTSSAASPLIIVRKPSSASRICIDYRALNDITIKGRHPLPRIEETLNQVHGTKYYTKIDLCRYVNQIRIQEGDE